MDKRDKVIDKVRKLLAMAGDTSSPNEAVIAAGMARKLIDKWQLSGDDIASVETSDMGTTDHITKSKRTSSFDGILAVAVANFNDAQVKYQRNSTGHFMLVFEGFTVDTVCAALMFNYLRDEAYKQAVKFETGRADRHAYRMGFAAGVADQVKALMRARRNLKTTTGTALVVTKRAAVLEYFSPVSYRVRRNAKMSGSGHAYSGGKAAGQRQGLDRQVSGSGQGVLT
jgi:hypothetical protein